LDNRDQKAPIRREEQGHITKVELMMNQLYWQIIIIFQVILIMEGWQVEPGLVQGKIVIVAPQVEIQDSCILTVEHRIRRLLMLMIASMKD
jgi:hypothetical protein